MSTRLERIEALLRQEIASVLLRGDLRDPRIQPSSNIAVTGVKVAPDLSQARIYIETLTHEAPKERVLAGLNACAGILRREISVHLHMKRIPMLRFVWDESLARGASIDQILHEIAQAERGPIATQAPSDGDESSSESEPE